jgi:hypothetical protein
MDRIYSSKTDKYTTARFFGIQRTSKDGLHWNVQALEREYANVDLGDEDFYKDTNGLVFSVTPESLQETFPIVGFFDLLPTGQTATIADVFSMIQSLYLYQAKLRDEKETELENSQKPLPEAE